MRRLGAMVVGMSLGVLCLAGPAAATAGPAPSPPPKCFVMQDLDLPTCTYMDGHWTVSYPSDSIDQNDGMPAGIVVVGVLGALGALCLFVWRVSMARNMARRSGMDVNEATAMTVLSDDGFEATYLASNLRPAVSPAAAPAESNPRSTADRLHELKQLHDQGLLTADEYAARRSAIIGAL